MSPNFPGCIDRPQCLLLYLRISEKPISSSKSVITDILSTPGCPPFPSSEWLNVICWKYIDLSKVLDSAHTTPRKPMSLMMRLSLPSESQNPLEESKPPLIMITPSPFISKQSPVSFLNDGTNLQYHLYSFEINK
jgi:hypothetical protein